MSLLLLSCTVFGRALSAVGAVKEEQAKVDEQLPFLETAAVFPTQLLVFCSSFANELLES